MALISCVATILGTNIWYEKRGDIFTPSVYVFPPPLSFKKKGHIWNICKVEENRSLCIIILSGVEQTQTYLFEYRLDNDYVFWSFNISADFIFK